MINTFVELDFLDILIKPEYLIKSMIVVTLDLTKVIIFYYIFILYDSLGKF